MNRLENIKNFGFEKKANDILAEMDREIYLTKVTYEIESLWDRAKELIDTANAYIECTSYELPEWCFYQSLGYLGFEFKGNREYLMDGISIGGWYRIVLQNGKLTYSGNRLEAEKRLSSFVNDFNKFEERFYEWIDKETITC